MDPGAVWLASYPRSGNTWVRFLLSAYIFGPPREWHDLNRIGPEVHFLVDDAKARGEGEAEMVERLRRVAERHRREPGFPAELILKTHFVRSAEHPLGRLATGAIHLLRDPRDVAVSGLNYLRFFHPDSPITDAAYIEGFIEAGGRPLWRERGYGTWAEHAASWLEQDELPVLAVRFESLKSDPGAELRRMLGFLGAPIDDDRIARAVEATSARRLGELEDVAVRGGVFGTADNPRRFIRAAAPGGSGEIRSIGDFGDGVERRFRDRFGPDMARFGYA